MVDEAMKLEIHPDMKLINFLEHREFVPEARIICLFRKRKTVTTGAVRYRKRPKDSSASRSQ